MKNRFTLFFAALLMTLGVCAQETTLTPEQIQAEGASKGYYTFEANVTGMNKLTSVDQFMTTDEQGNSVGKQIMIQHCHEGTEHEGHEGYWLTIYSLTTDNTHKVYMQSNPVGVGIFTPVKVDNEGTFKLQTSHMRLVENTTCYLTKYNDQTQAITTSANSQYFGNYKFVPAGEGKWKIEFQDFNTAGSAFLWVDTQDEEKPELGVYQIQNGLTGAALDKQNRKISLGYFYVYEVTETQGEVKYVKDATVNLIGQGGNTITGTHTGWSDFYEFVMSGDAYGCTLLNYHYDDATNTITSNIDFPFSITGDYVQVPVYLHANASTSKRVAVVDGALKVIDNEEGDTNPNSQWYIRPRIEGLKITYALQNVGTGKYIYFTPTSSAISLNDSPAYFNLEKYANLPSGASEDAVRFTFTYKANNYSYSYCLYNSSWGFTSGQTSNNYGGYNFIVSTVSSANTDLGFIQKYPAGTSFWNKGTVDVTNATQCPIAVKSMLEAQEHEFREATHEIYCASTAIKVNSRSDVSVTFTYDGGGHLLNIFGVDIVHLDGTAFVFDYHQGTAGTSPKKNTYTLKNVPAGEYRIRYFVCNTPKLTGYQGHNLDKNAGTITVTGANLRLKPSDAPNGDWANNTYWYTINQGLCTGNRICAEPAYTDWSNNLMLDNNDVAMNSAALWCFVGNDTEGYKIYNRAWGADYALATIGSEEHARTMMKPVAEASTYDIDFHAYQNGKGQFFIRMHNSTDFLNDRDNYLAKWDSEYSYGTDGSVMMINEVLNTEVFDNRLTPVVEKLQKEWAPWTGDGANADINTAYENNSSFASWVLGRQQLAELLNGKVFKFVNKSTSEDGRVGRALGVIEVKDMGGIAPKNDGQKYVDEYLQIINNNDGTYKLFHFGTNKYFQNPDAANITENSADAANYTFEIYQNEVQAVHFVSGNEHMHLGNEGNSYKILAWGGIDDSNSRWDVIYDEEAQNLADLIAQAKARYAQTQADAYQANVGVPGYANAESTTALFNTFNGGLYGKTFAEATDALNGAMNVVAEAEKEVFFPTNCYFTITNKNYSLVYNADKTERDEAYSSEFVWTTDNVDATSLNHLWGFYRDEETGDYYLYNVGKRQFVNSKGKGDFWGNTWIFSDFPVTITMKALDTPYFHIEGDNLTLSVSTGYTGPVITYYEVGDQGIDQGVPMRFNKSTVAVDQDLLNELKSKEILALTSGFYTLKYNDLYLNDKTVTGNTIRTLTAMTDSKIENIFYYTTDKEMVGYSSGYGFTYGFCNTGKPEEGYNTFTFKVSHEPGKYLIKSNEGKSVLGWGDRYLIVNTENNFTDNGVWNKKLASAWAIEEVAELPVKLTTAQNETGAYGTIWSPVALEIPEGITAYTGYVTSECELVLEAITGGVIPAETGVVLWNETAEATYVQNLKIADAVATAVSGDNKFVGWVMTKANPNTTDGDYYSLGIKNNNMAFYRYVGTNLQGFRARIQKSDAPANATALTIRFNNATGIEEVISAFQNGAIYDLSGRRVVAPTKGVYIMNGKKVFIK